MMIRFLCVLIFSLFSLNAVYARSPVVLMTDFGLNDGAVSAMKGVIYGVNQQAVIADLTHNIEPYNIHEGAYRLFQVMHYYPKGTVFVCVVDPGVGTERKSVVAKTKNGYYVVTPDNGMLTYIGKQYGIEEIRQIDESTNRLPQSLTSHTFHGRDVYSYTGARLASGVISYRQVGKLLPSDDYVKLPVQMAYIHSNEIVASVVALDGVYGNIWTNIDETLLQKMNMKAGDQLQVKMLDQTGRVVYRSNVLFAKTFGQVKIGKPLAYVNSVANLAIALNQGNFAKKYKITPGFLVHVSVLHA